MICSIGKKIGGKIYVHRQYGDMFPLVEERREVLEEQFPDFDYTILKIDTQLGTVSFIQCDDFNTAHEPTVGVSMVVDAGGNIRRIGASSDPWVYHHKWMMVDEDYEGFDIEESKRRSESWEDLGFDKNRIGKKSYWEKCLKNKGLPL